MNDSITKRDSVSESTRRCDGVSPTPWRVEKSPANSNFWVVRCDTGVSLATVWHEADAALIAEAVNYHDRLRDLVQRMIPGVEASLAVSNAEGEALDRWLALLREAREAVGESMKDGGAE